MGKTSDEIFQNDWEKIPIKSFGIKKAGISGICQKIHEANRALELHTGLYSLGVVSKSPGK